MIGFKKWLEQGQPKITELIKNKKNGRPKTIDAVNNGVTYRALIARIKAALH